MNTRVTCKFCAAGSFPGGPAAGGQPCPTAGGEADPPPPPLQAHGDGAGTQGKLQVSRSAAPQILLCQRMPGSYLGQL